MFKSNYVRIKQNFLSIMRQLFYYGCTVTFLCCQNTLSSPEPESTSNLTPLVVTKSSNQDTETIKEILQQQTDKIEEMEMVNEEIAIPKETKAKKNNIMETTPKKDIKDRLADIKTEHSKNKKRNARVKAESKKRRK